MGKMIKDIRFGIRLLLKHPGFTMAAVLTLAIGVGASTTAPPREVLRLVLRQGLYLIAIGIGLGLIGALALRSLITSLLFEVKPSDPVTLFAVALLLTAVALIACYIPARRATKVDPLVALRSE